MATQDIYTSNQGDMFDLIAFRVYGSEKYCVDLMLANPDYRDLAIFDGGVGIVCPDIEVERASPLPPWKS